MNAFPSYIDLEFTARCNLACGFCFGPRDDRSVADLGRAFWSNVIAEVARRGAQGIVVSGGEPTLVGELPALLATAKALGLKTVVSTHGRHTSKVAKIAAHSDWIALPADAASREGLVEMRGDTWGLPQAAKLARELKVLAPHVRIKLGSVGTRLNVRELVRLAQDLREYEPMPFDTWKIYQYTPRRKFAGRRELYEMSDAQFAALENAVRATGVPNWSMPSFRPMRPEGGPTCSSIPTARSRSRTRANPSATRCLAMLQWKAWACSTAWQPGSLARTRGTSR